MLVEKDPPPHSPLCFVLNMKLVFLLSPLRLKYREIDTMLYLTNVAESLHSQTEQSLKYMNSSSTSNSSSSTVTVWSFFFSSLCQNKQAFKCLFTQRWLKVTTYKHLLHHRCFAVTHQVLTLTFEGNAMWTPSQAGRGRKQKN